MKKICSILMVIATMALMVACGGDDATSVGGNGSGGNDKPSGKSSVGAWFMQEGNYLLVLDFKDNSSVMLHIYEISGDVYYKTYGSGTFTKKDNSITFNIGGEASPATIIDDVMHINDPTLGNIQMKKVTTSVQNSINTMEAYFDKVQQDAIGEWYAQIASDLYYVMKFETTSSGKIILYYGKHTDELIFSWTRGNNMKFSSDEGNSFKFYMKNGALSLVITNTSDGKSEEMTFSRMTDEVKKKIEDMQNAKMLTSGYYVEKNPDMKEYFTLTVSDDYILQTLSVYGQKTLLEGRYQIIDDYMIVNADVNGDGKIDDNDKFRVAVNGDEVTIGNITFVRTEITANKLVGNWQAYRTVGAEFKIDGTLKESWDWELSGVSTGDEEKDNDNVRIFLLGDTFESWKMRYGTWELQQSGTYTFYDRLLSLRYEKSGYGVRVDDWTVVSISDSKGIIERWDGEQYVAYYMEKI
jgi:hypothetical protein